MNPKIVSTILGGVLGAVILFAPHGGWKFIILGLFILLGWAIGKIIVGEWDILELYERFISRRKGGGRPQ